MSKKKLEIFTDKYSMWSLSVPIAYVANWLYGYNSVPPLLHIYHLGRSIYDRLSFSYKNENVSKFVNKDLIINDTRYSLTEFKANYGWSLTEVISVVGLLHGFLSFSNSVFPTFYPDHLNKAIKYTPLFTIGMSIINLFTDVDEASLEVHYDIVTIPNEVEFIQPVDLQDQDQMDSLKNEVTTITD